MIDATPHSLPDTFAPHYLAAPALALVLCDRTEVPGYRPVLPLCGPISPV